MTGPWHSRNGIGNTCAVMTQHDYCNSHYFNTFGGVRVTSAEACCGCGGGPGRRFNLLWNRSVSGSDSICSCGVAYSGSDVTNGVATCVEKTCADSDGAGAAATCGSGASCSDGSVDDGYKSIAMQDLLEFPQQMDQPRVSNKRVRTLTVQVQLLHVVVVQHVQTTV